MESIEYSQSDQSLLQEEYHAFLELHKISNGFVMFVKSESQITWVLVAPYILPAKVNREDGSHMQAAALHQDH